MDDLKKKSFFIKDFPVKEFHPFSRNTLNANKERKREREKKIKINKPNISKSYIL